ncbi:hypothetical protein SPONN_1473 [uncultured Candidatus Thioglobus sp.]|nr:hypothetical protein SPONL_2276 [uncultured Candidatus Thioglobus sp.]SMM98621.1 hypothetical protein SPONL_2278 [uncultured Candidatus Thioglobus sp.]SMN02596.1 hypothetical protein SPONN_1473 [uncultured Candidatus Thioglobus sp.]
MTNIAVKSVQALDDYQLNIVFNNNEQGVLDMKPYLNFGVFKRIKDVKVFNSVSVAFDTVEWDKEIDLDPEFVYQKTYKTQENNDK